MKRSSLLIAIVALPCFAYSQIIIPAGTTISSANTPDIAIATGSNVTNASSYDFSTAKVHLNLTGTTQTVNGNLSLARLRVGGGGNKIINGTFTVREEINFVQGFLQSSPTGKITFTGDQSGLSGASSASFVDGAFYLTGTGLLRFPVGAQTVGFAPLTIESGSGAETGAELLNEQNSLVPAISEVEISEIIGSYYWNIITAQPIASRIKVAMPSNPGFSGDVSAVVLEADATGGEAYNLGGTFDEAENSVTSVAPVTRPVIAVGSSTEIDITIHDLISPFKVDGYNDFLEIDNIGKFPENTVTLLDRYGVVIKEWNNFSNFEDPVNPNQDVYNFAKLSPGNYICIVEYGNTTQAPRKKSQMITVLKN
jgi:hypothetical protein